MLLSSSFRGLYKRKWQPKKVEAEHLINWCFGSRKLSVTKKCSPRQPNKFPRGEAQFTSRGLCFDKTSDRHVHETRLTINGCRSKVYSAPLWALAGVRERFVSIAFFLRSESNSQLQCVKDQNVLILFWIFWSRARRINTIWSNLKLSGGSTQHQKSISE
jgi:hypothetical protein